MIVVPVGAVQEQWCRDYMEAKGGIYLSPYVQFLVWERDGQPKWVVAFDDWIGTTCHLHMASTKGYLSPLGLIRAVFHHAFVTMKRTHVFGLVNSLNTAAMRYDTWIGFKEIVRVPGCHQGGGDMVLFCMKAEECRWIEKEARDGQAHTAG